MVGIMDYIKEEIQKENPSKKKILSYLVDLRKNEKHDSHTDSDFYDIVGETFNLNLIFFMDSIYKNLKKKVNKLFGEEKEYEMEKYLIENYGLYSREQAVNRIKQEFEKADRSKEVNWRLFLKAKILSYLKDLLSKKEYKHLSDFDFNFIVGETFRLDPEFFMDLLCSDLRQRMKKKNRLEMDKYVVEKYSLGDGEHILYEFEGNIKQTEYFPRRKRSPLSIIVKSGSIFLTNYRFIAQGILDAEGGHNPAAGWMTTHWFLISGGSERKKRINALIESSPPYGYQFPIKNNLRLQKTSNSIRYFLERDNRSYRILIKLSKSLKREEHADKLFEILCKNAEPVVNIIKRILDMDVKPKKKQNAIESILYNLWFQHEYDYPNFSDSEYIEFIGETYKLDPTFFMTLIYPKIESWSFLSFLRVKEEIVKLIDKLNKEIPKKPPSKPEEEGKYIKFVSE
ncbi:MAG: hypothetical protein ACFFDN_45280 [Candidatus Hodarchaeota archaeon]